MMSQTLVEPQIFAHLLLRSVTFMINLPGETWRRKPISSLVKSIKTLFSGNTASESSSLLSISRRGDMIDVIR